MTEAEYLIQAAQKFEGGMNLVLRRGRYGMLEHEGRYAFVYVSGDTLRSIKFQVDQVELYGTVHIASGWSPSDFPWARRSGHMVVFSWWVETQVRDEGSPESDTWCWHQLHRDVIEYFK